jgi:hypothetical protein
MAIDKSAIRMWTLSIFSISLVGINLLAVVYHALNGLSAVRRSVKFSEGTIQAGLSSVFAAIGHALGFSSDHRKVGKVYEAFLAKLHTKT